MNNLSLDFKTAQNSFVGHAYPDFGFRDPLNYELRGETIPEEGQEHAQASKNGQAYKIWEFMYNYIAEKPKYERFNNTVDMKVQEKNELLEKRIIQTKAQQDEKRQRLRIVPCFGSDINPPGSMNENANEPVEPESPTRILEGKLKTALDEDRLLSSALE